MMEFEAKLVAITDESPTVKSFVLDLQGAEMDFLPGQYIDLFMDALESGKAAGYSITSSPLERHAISIAVKKLPGARATEYLHEHAKVGDTFVLQGPGGDFHYEARSASSLMLIAGGVGITPLMSMLRYFLASQPGNQLALVYSAQTPRELLFRDELDAMARDNPSLSAVFTVTRPGHGTWDGHVGRIDSGLLRANMPTPDPLYYICGPRGMAEDITALLHELGVNDSRIRSETWW